MKYKLSILIVIFIAFALRFYQLGNNPPSLTWDEAAWGYNAYSLGVNGKDEFGTFLPYKYLLSFGDYKPPVYAYLDVLPVKFFGLTPFAVRFPSAILGVLTVFITFFLTKRIFYSSEKKNLYGLLAAGVLATSPWHIMLSRAAFEANVATFFLVSGVWLFLGGVQERKWYLSLSAVSFALSLYTFNSARVVAPLLAIMLGVIFCKTLFKYKRQTIIAGIIGVLLVAPLVPYLLSPDASLRYKEVNIFSDTKPLERSNQAIANDGNAIWSKVINNRRLVYGLDFLEHFFDQLRPDFLFIHGDNNPKFSIQDVGQMYLWDLPFFIIGFFYLFRKREGYWWIVPLWMALGIVPAATSLPTPHALRSEATLPTFQIITALGVAFALEIFSQRVKKKVYGYALIGIVFLLLAVNIFYFQFEYYRQYPNRFSGVWQYGYVGLMLYLKENGSKYQTIYDSGHLGRPYIYYLFYNKTNPEDFRKTAKVRQDGFGFVYVDSFGKYRFPSNMDQVPHTGSALYVVGAKEVPAGVKVLKVVRDINGVPDLAIYTY